MKKLFDFIIVILLYTILPNNFIIAQSEPASGGGVFSGFSNIKRRILIRPGVLFPANVSNAYTNAIPVGDGTYYFKFDLVKGGMYNFIFQAYINGSWQYEQIPNRGKFPVTTNSTPSILSDPDGGYITTIDGYARRVITIPDNASVYYVYCNFGHHPNPPSLEAIPGDNHIILKIKSEGRWGYLEPDVEYGGWFEIYKSTNDRGPYTFITNLSAGMGNYVYFTDTNVTNYKTYYYVAIARDAYKNTNSSVIRGPLTKEIDIPDYNTCVEQDNIDANMYSGYAQQQMVIPKEQVKVIFKVENIKWDVVEQNNYIVYLTPWEKDGRKYFFKPAARIVKVKPCPCVTEGGKKDGG